MGHFMMLNGRGDLPQIILTPGPPPRLPRRHDGGNGEPDNNADNGDDDEHLDKCDTAVLPLTQLTGSTASVRDGGVDRRHPGVFRNCVPFTKQWNRV
jgi:hypothetical protein